MEVTVCEISPLEIPMEILLEADESEKSIERYLAGSICYGVFVDGQLSGACVTGPVSAGTVELFNIAILPTYQKKGLGTRLLQFAIDDLSKKGHCRIILGTGTFGYQLSFYHRAGFRVDAVVKDHFIQHYDMPIFEDGIQLKDQLRLYLPL